MAHILVVDDELAYRKGIVYGLQRAGHTVAEAESKQQAREQVRSTSFNIVVLDLCVPTEREGLDILAMVKAQQQDVLVLMTTAHGTIERAVEAIKAGADDFILKGFTTEELQFRLERLLEGQRLRLEHHRLAEENERLRREVQTRFQYATIIGASEPMQRALRLLSRVVDDGDSTVLLLGENGTGKELFARAIHYNGPRKDKPFVVVNCSALPEHLLESELFGFERGSFTGATKDKPGKLEVADGGTLFFDEIGEVSSKIQLELLRFLQERTFERVGSNTLITVDVRIVAATNRNLSEEVKQGRFREDLFYRLHVIPLSIPPLRERKEDIPLLVDHFVALMEKEKGRRIRFSNEALARLEAHMWQGNVRELENLVERLVVMAEHELITPADLPPEFGIRDEKQAFEQAMKRRSLQEACDEFERLFLLKQLEKHHWNITEVANAIGERRDTLSRKVKRYKLKSE
jgi:DNA-binding NtrC family response regulator